MKDFKRRHGQDLHKGTDARSHKTLIDKKKEKMLARANSNKDSNRKSGPRKFSEKAQAKITAAARPTRSKMIVKSKGGRGRR